MTDFIKLEGIEEAKRDFEPKIVDQSIKSSVNKLRKRVKTAASKQIRDKFKIKAAVLSKKIETRLFSDGATAEISIKSSSIGLLNFGASAIRGRSKIGGSKGVLKRTTLKRRGRNQGVTASIVKGSRFTLPNAFIAKGKRGRGELDISNAQVFIRMRNGGLRSVRVISPSSMFAQEVVMRRLRQVVDEDFPKLLAHELDRRSRK